MVVQAPRCRPEVKRVVDRSPLMMFGISLPSFEHGMKANLPSWQAHQTVLRFVANRCTRCIAKGVTEQSVRA